MKRITVFTFSFLSLLLLLPSVSIAHSSSYYDPYFYTILNVLPNDPPIAGRPSDIYISVFNATTGEPISALDTVHERKMHVFVVNDRLDEIYHIHPEDRDDGLSLINQGKYLINYTFPEAGFYVILADFTKGGVGVLKMFDIFALSSESDSFAPERESPEPDFSRSKYFGEYKVSINLPDKIVAGEEVQIDYRIERLDEPVRDLQQYLGSEMHVIFVRSDLLKASHAHAYVPFHSIHAGKMTQRYYGPNVPVRHVFQEPGDYVVFSQFLHRGEVVTTKFWIKVEANLFMTLYSYIPYTIPAGLALFIFKRDASRLFRKLRCFMKI